jgi:hypothetical protein
MKLADAERHGDLYPDRHLNVFVPFQSHDLDYNVTRALISTLRWSRPDLTQEFLREVAGLEATDGVYHHDMGACDYEDFDPGRVPNQVVLGISGAGEVARNLPSLDDVDQDHLVSIINAGLPLEHTLEELRRALASPELTLDELAVLAHTLDELADGSMPDGWIFSPEAGVCVLIEAKLLRYLDLYQLRRYSEVWYGRSQAAEDLVLRTWQQVGAFFSARRGDADPRTAFLCGQLCDYLDLLGLTAFEGFKPYDFDGDTLHESLPKFLHFAQAVRERAIRGGQPLGAVQVTATGARLPFADAALPGELRLDLLEEGLRLELRCGDAVEGRLAGRLATDALLAAHEEPGEGAGPLEGLNGSFSVRVERLRGAGQTHVEKVTYREPLSEATWELVVSELRRQHLPPGAQDSTGVSRRGALSIGTLIDRHDAVGDGDGGKVLDRAAEIVTSLSHTARALLPNTQPVAG